MTIDEAIATLQEMAFTLNLTPHDRCGGAINLGLEALKHIQWLRRRPFGDEFITLPGETEEVKG